MTIEIPIRSGPFNYVLVRADGTTVEIHPDDAQLAAGSTSVDVEQGDQILEIALSSTSDPDLDPARGQLWP